MNHVGARDPFYNDRMDDPRLNSGASSSKQTPAFIDDLNGAIRDNPLAAGLIGLGAAWLLFGNRGFGAVASVAQNGAELVGAAARNAGESLSEGWNRTARSLGGAAEDMEDRGASLANAAQGAVGTASRAAKSAGSAAQDALSRTSEQVSGMASDIADYATSASHQMMRSSADLAGTAQDNLKDAFERQPLLLGVIGLAIGAGLASTFAATPVERQYLGEASGTVRAKAGDLAAAAREKAEGVMAEVASEAERQGLTPAAAKNAVSGFADKAKAVASAAVDGVRGSRP